MANAPEDPGAPGPPRPPARRGFRDVPLVPEDEVNGADEALRLGGEEQAPPGDAELAATLDAPEPPDPSLHRPSRSSSLQSRIIGLAALLLISASFAWELVSGWGAASSTAEQPTEPDQLRITSPRGRVRAWTGFRWDGPRVPGGVYTLEIWDADAPPGSDPIVRMTSLTEREFVPSQELPPRIRLRLRALDARGERIDEVERDLALTP